MMRFGGPKGEEAEFLKEAMSALPHVGAVLVKQEADHLSTDVPLGTRYRVFPLTRKTHRLGIDFSTNQDVYSDMVYARREDDPNDPGGWVPVGWLKIEED